MKRLGHCVICAILYATIAYTQTFILKEDVVLKYGETFDSIISEADAVAQKQCFMQFSGRIQSRYASGATGALFITVNGLPVSIERIVNKKPYFIYGGRKVPWFDAKGRWYLPYYPFDKGDTEEISDGKPIHEFVVDIYSALKPGTNNISFRNGLVEIPDAIIELKHIVLHVGSAYRKSEIPPDVDNTRSAAFQEFRKKAMGYHAGVAVHFNTNLPFEPVLEDPVFPRNNFTQDYDVLLESNGSMRIGLHGEHYRIQSQFGSSGTGWKKFGVDYTSSDWDSFTVADKSIVAETKKYRLQRTIVKTDHCVEIADTFVNKTDGDLPLAYMNFIEVPDINQVTEFRLFGQAYENFCINTRGDENIARAQRATFTPAAYLALQKCAIGLYIGDDNYRNHASFIAWDNTLAIGDEMLYLGPRKKYTYSWKLYPLAQRGFYQFVNAVRSDLRLYQEMPGLFGFIYKKDFENNLTAAQINDFFSNTGITIPCVLPDYTDIKNSPLSTLYGTEEPDIIRMGLAAATNFIRRARAAGIGFPFLVYTDAHLVRTIGDNDLSGGQRWKERLFDSLLLNDEGQAISYRSGMWLYPVLPTLHTRAGMQFLETLKIYLNDQCFNGLFLDEWNHSMHRISYAHEDGSSALLDKDCALVRKIGMVSILINDFQTRTVEELMRRGAPVYANQFDNTVAASQLPICHFAEPVADFDDYLLSAALFGRTPLSLNFARVTTNIWNDAIGFLQRGVLMCYYSRRLTGDHALKKIYPITVKEVWPGCVIGNNKIVTICSGTYSLNHKKPLVAYVYGATNEVGQLIAQVRGSYVSNGNTWISVRVPPGQMAVIIED